MSIGKVLFASAVAGWVFLGGIMTGGELTMENEFHTECFTVEWYDDGIAGEPVDCKTNEPLKGEGIFYLHEDLKTYDIAIEGGDVVKIRWTNQQAEQGEWLAPASIERNDGE